MNLETEEELSKHKETLSTNQWIEGNDHVTVLLPFSSKDRLIDFSIVLSDVSHCDSVISIRTDIKKLELLLTIYSSKKEFKSLEKKIMKLYNSSN